MRRREIDWEDGSIEKWSDEHRKEVWAWREAKELANSILEVLGTKYYMQRTLIRWGVTESRLGMVPGCLVTKFSPY